jgi:hypothetical protein
MQKQKEVSTLVGIAIIITGIVVLFGGVFAYKYFLNKGQDQTGKACTTDAKICPDGSGVGRTGPNCEFAECPTDWRTYTNNDYGFSISFPDSWKGYSVEINSWNGYLVNDNNTKYSGVKIVFKNPQSTTNQPWQDIPVMIITPDIWKLIEQEKIAVSAAPIGPSKIGENQKYIFATPPRWYGFTDAIGIEEALNIVKTFKAF